MAERIPCTEVTRLQGYKPPNSSSDYQTIPLEKIEDFGVHADAYYPIPITIFKSKLDDELLGLLWNKYWVNTLSQTPLISVRRHCSCGLQFIFDTASNCTEPRVRCRAAI